MINNSKKKPVIVSKADIIKAGPAAVNTSNNNMLNQNNQAVHVVSNTGAQMQASCFNN